MSTRSGITYEQARSMARFSRPLRAEPRRRHAAAPIAPQRPEPLEGAELARQLGTMHDKGTAKLMNALSERVVGDVGAKAAG